jgi:opacity protein-like surface antigen
VATCAVAALLLAATAAGAGAQDPESTLSRLGLDRLRLTGVGATWGKVRPSQIEPADAVGVHADYGEVSSRWRAVFGVTYWGSDYRNAVVRRLADSVLAAVDDPTGDATVDLGRVRVSVIALTADARWSPRRRPVAWIRPYVGGSIGGYAMNAEGRVISGTFLESALDNVSAGVAAVGGADLGIAPNLTLGVHARYDVLSGSRFATLRTGLTYIFRSREGS